MKRLSILCFATLLLAVNVYRMGEQIDAQTRAIDAQTCAIEELAHNVCDGVPHPEARPRS